jgi:hypothetical protein
MLPVLLKHFPHRAVVGSHERIATMRGMRAAIERTRAPERRSDHGQIAKPQGPPMWKPQLDPEARKHQIAHRYWAADGRAANS